jgi:hypothetical protein
MCTIVNSLPNCDELALLRNKNLICVSVFVQVSPSSNGVNSVSLDTILLSFFEPDYVAIILLSFYDFFL